MVPDEAIRSDVKARRVAVIAVHGVADQQPGDTVGAIANLLLNLNEGARPAYARVSEQSIRVPVRRVNVPAPAAGTRASRDGQAGFVERAPQLRKAYKTKKATEDDDPSRWVVDDFMTSLLEAYEPEGPAETFETTRIELHREASDAGAAGAAVDVDVFEMYWADLSRLTRSFLRMFAELYQLLFHLASLGVHAVTSAEVATAKNNEKDGVWPWWRRSQWLSARLLSIGFPVLNLVLAGLLVAILAEWISPSTAAFLDGSTLGAAAAAVLGYRAYRRGRGRWLFAPAALLLAAGVALGIKASADPLSIVALVPDWPTRLLVTDALLVVGVIIAIIVRLYERVRPGAERAAAAAGLLVLAAVLGRLWITGRDLPAASATLFGGEIAYAMLSIVWVLFILASWVAWASGGSITRAYRRRAREATLAAQTTPSTAAQIAAARLARERDRLSQAAWTSRLTLAVPAASFLIITVTIWAGLWSATAGTPENRAPVPCVTRDGVCAANADRLSDTPLQGPAGAVLTIGWTRTRGLSVPNHALLPGTSDDILATLEGTPVSLGHLAIDSARRAHVTSAATPRAVIPLGQPVALSATPADPTSSPVLTGTATAEVDDAYLRRPYVLRVPVLHWLIAGVPPRWSDAGVTSDAVYNVIWDFIMAAAGPGYGLLMATVLLVIVLSVYALLPPVLTEIFPSLGADAGRLGRWLNDGFFVLRWAGRLLYAAVIFGLPLAFVIVWLIGAPRSMGLWAFNERLLGYGGLLLVPAATGLFAFGGRLKHLLLGFRNVLDVALDVDNYLREHPRTSCPRAKMCARMASLLRTVATDSARYDAIVIIAHSQGTMIGADLLRYLQREDVQRENPDLPILRERVVKFFTMGSPLRQLYSLRFPHLYGWARHFATAPANQTDPIPDHQWPSPDALGLRKWVNVYRSGDYIGRHLWRPDACAFGFDAALAETRSPWPATPIPPDVTSSDAAGTRVEYRLGTGAHTHYWDAHAPLVARQLDQLITER